MAGRCWLVKVACLDWQQLWRTKIAHSGGSICRSSPKTPSLWGTISAHRAWHVLDYSVSAVQWAGDRMIVGWSRVQRWTIINLSASLLSSLVHRQDYTQLYSIQVFSINAKLSFRHRASAFRLILPASSLESRSYPPSLIAYTLTRSIQSDNRICTIHPGKR